MSRKRSTIDASPAPVYNLCMKTQKLVYAVNGEEVKKGDWGFFMDEWWVIEETLLPTPESAEGLLMVRHLYRQEERLTVSPGLVRAAWQPTQN